MGAFSLLLLAISAASDAHALPNFRTMSETIFPGGQPLVRQVQTAPSTDEFAAYQGLHAEAANGDVARIVELLSAGANIDQRDWYGRTPLMIAAYRGHYDAARTLIKANADLNALENDRYDFLTIAAVLDDVKMVKLAIDSGADTSLVTSPYKGTALIASAHLGHVEVVRALIAGGSPLDHVNNLGWTALIEAIVLGDGGPRHIAIVRALLVAGANFDLPDSNNVRPLSQPRPRGHDEITRLLERAGARP